MKIGYKATYNMVAHNDFVYEVGKTYVHDGKIEICSSGFHYCNNMEDVLRFYEPTRHFVLLEVEILSDNIIDEGYKCVTDKIKILRIIPLEEHKLFTVNVLTSNTDVYNSISGKTYRSSYDEKNRIIVKSNFFKRTIIKYDDRGNIIYINRKKNDISSLDSDINGWSTELTELKYDDKNVLIELKTRRNDKENTWQVKYENDLVTFTSDSRTRSGPCKNFNVKNFL